MNKKYTKNLIVMLIMVIAVIAVTIFCIKKKTEKPKQTVSTAAVEQIVGPKDVVVTPAAVAEPSSTPEDRTKKMATFFQGPKAWKSRVEWSGEWGTTMDDGSAFGSFGCGLCCMANVYTSYTPYQCSPVDMYRYAQKVSEYGGYGAIDWGFMKNTMEQAGFTCRAGKKPAKYADFQKLVADGLATIVVVSSNDSTCYWKDTPGHYVTLLMYDADTDRIFLGDSGNLSHNRQWVSLKKVYRSLKMANNRQYLTFTNYDEKKDTWKHKKISGKCVLPKGWDNSGK